MGNDYVTTASLTYITQFKFRVGVLILNLATFKKVSLGCVQETNYIIKYCQESRKILRWTVLAFNYRRNEKLV